MTALVIDSTAESTPGPVWDSEFTPGQTCVTLP